MSAYNVICAVTGVAVDRLRQEMPRLSSVATTIFSPPVIITHHCSGQLVFQVDLPVDCSALWSGGVKRSHLNIPQRLDGSVVAASSPTTTIISSDFQLSFVLRIVITFSTDSSASVREASAVKGLKKRPRIYGSRQSVQQNSSSAFGNSGTTKSVA